MSTTPFVCALSHAHGDISRALESFAFHLDAKQYERAGIELGRIQELGERIAATCRLAADALSEDAWKARRTEVPSE